MCPSLTAIETVKQIVADLPHLPGVYIMYDKTGKALYVGKARDLKNRVTNYTTFAGKNQRLATMIAQVADIEFITTRNEAEALLLEANVIKRLQPKYNILLKDDKSFPFLLVTNHDFPRICKYRGNRDKAQGIYFGPFASVAALNKLLSQLQKAFLLRPCSDRYFTGRTRACLQYQIKRCSAPCIGLISKEDYAALLDQALLFLRGDNRMIQHDLLQQMEQASHKLDYERAAILRDRLQAITQIQQEQGLVIDDIQDTDIWALVRQADVISIQIFLFRNGQNYGSKQYFLRGGAVQNPEEILASFMLQFYSKHHPPPYLLLNYLPLDSKLIATALSNIAGRKIAIHQPKRGAKYALVQQVVDNAKQALALHLNTRYNQQQLIERLAKLANMRYPPVRIEIYDNSHIAGSDAIGAMVVAGEDGFIKHQYRKFNIKTAAGDDDYAMMREVISRRFRNILQNKSTSPQSPCGADNNINFEKLLLIIDGGKGQLAAVQQVMLQLGIIGKVAVIAVAKGANRNAGREKIFVPKYTTKIPDYQLNQSSLNIDSATENKIQEITIEDIISGYQQIELPTDDPLLHYIQRLRDEAHRYAIGAHRVKRSSHITQSALDSIAGIGAKRKKALLYHFGSLEAIRNASLAEISSVDGISANLAAAIWNYFHG